MNRMAWLGIVGLLVGSASTAGEARLKIQCSGPVYSVAFSPDGKTLASAGDDDNIELWDPVTGNNAATLRARDCEIVTIHSVVFSPNGKTLASVSYCPATVRLWDLAASNNNVTLEIVSPRASVAFTPDSRVLASADEDSAKLRLWDVATGKNIAAFDAPAYTPLAFSADGRSMASGGEGRTIKLWDFSTRRSTATLPVNFETIRCLVFSPNGKLLAAAGDVRDIRSTAPIHRYINEIRLWGLTSDRQTRTLTGNSVAFSHDAKTLASGGEDGILKLWDLATARNMATFRGHQKSVTCIAFSPDGKTLASGSGDGTVKLWDVTKLTEVDD